METITFTADLERNIRMMQELFRNLAMRFSFSLGNS